MEMNETRRIESKRASKVPESLEYYLGEGACVAVRQGNLSGHFGVLWAAKGAEAAGATGADACNKMDGLIRGAEKVSGPTASDAKSK